MTKSEASSEASSELPQALEIVQVPLFLAQIVQRDTVQSVMDYLHYNQSMIDKMKLWMTEIVHAKPAAISMNPNTAPSISPGVSLDGGKADDSLTKKKVANAPSAKQLAYRQHMKDELPLMKDKLFKEQPMLSKRELHQKALKLVAGMWSEKSSKLPGLDSNKVMQTSDIGNPVSEESSDCEMDCEMDCVVHEGMRYGKAPDGKVYSVDGDHVGMWTEDDGVKLH